MVRTGWLLFWGLILTGQLAGLAAAEDEKADSPEARIDQLAAEALASASLADAEDLLGRARRQLESEAGGVKPLTRDFLRAHLDLTYGRILAAAWEKDPQQDPLRQQAQQLLRQTILDHKNLEEQAAAEADRLERKLAADVEKNAWWRQVGGYLSRIAFNRAWAAYSLALVTPAPAERQTLLAEALGLFGQFTHAGYRAHPVVAECFLGEALCYYQLQRYYRVLERLDLDTIHASNTPERIYKKITWLRLTAAGAVPSPWYAVRAAEQYFHDTQRTSYDPQELELALSWAQSLKALLEDPAARSIAGPLRQRIERVAVIVYPYGQPWHGRLADLIEPFAVESPAACMILARRYFHKQDYARAAAEAQSGLLTLGQVPAMQLAADLRYLRAAACWNQQAWSQAFQAAWDFVALHESDPRAAGMYPQALGAARRDWQGDRRVAAADVKLFLDLLDIRQPDTVPPDERRWSRGWFLLADQQYAAAERQLESIAPGGAFHRSALYGRALAAFRQFEQRKLAAAADRPADGVDQEPLRRAVGAIETFLPLATAGGGADETSLSTSADAESLSTSMVELCLAVARELLEVSPPDPNAALGLLDGIEQTAGLLPTRDPQVLLNRLAGRAAANGDDSWQRRSALRLEACVVQADLPTAALWLEVFLTRPSPDASSAAALVRAANRLELLVDRPTVSPATEQAVGIRLVRLYEQFLREASESPDSPWASQEPILRRRLARNLLRCRRRLEAVDQYRRILADHGIRSNSDVVRSLAQTYEQLQQYDAAAQQWRTLAYGLEARSDGWYEAHYRWIVCCRLAGQTDQAGRLLALFRLRHDPVESAKWSELFDRLEENSPIATSHK
ncbi:MAG: hypothetical protein JW810_07515 [Sedimentisphaerales bacterium]|nr:hypothetical protein [Sedimentisphaerales bacterium]